MCVCLCQFLSMWRVEASGGKGKPGSGGLMMAAGSSTVPVNEWLLTRSLMTGVGFEEGRQSKGGSW